MSVHTGRKTAEDESPLAQLETSKQKISEAIGGYIELIGDIENERESDSLPKDEKEFARLERVLGEAKSKYNVVEFAARELTEQTDLAAWLVKRAVKLGDE